MNNSKILLKRAALIFLICLLSRGAFLGFALQKNGWNTSTLIWGYYSPHFYNSAKYVADKHEDPNMTFLAKLSRTAKRDVPLYLVVLSIFFAILGPSILLAVFVNIFLFCLSACLFYKIGTDIFGEEAGFPAAVIFSLYPSLVPNLTLPQPESLFLFLFLSGIYFFVSFLKNGNLRNLIFATAFVALATLTKEAAIFLPLVMAVLILARFIKNLKQATKPLCFLIIVYLAAVSPWFVRNYYALGRFTLSSKTSGYARFIKKQIVAPTEQNKAPALKQPIDKNRTSNYFSPILDYFKKRKHFFGGTGTLSIMRASGYNVTEIEPAMKNPSPVEFLIALKKAGRRWFVFNALTLIFIGFVYCTSFVALLLLFIRKQYMELFSFISIIVYFLVVYYFHYNSRYFIPIVPFLALLSGYLISNIRGLIRKRG